MNINTLPNWLTMGRALAVPLVILLASFDGVFFGTTAAVVFTLAAITDILDGYLARRYNQVSEFGMLVDPIADKIIVASAFVMLVHLGRAPAWMVALIISREFAVSGLRAFAGTRKVVIAARPSGKVKTLLQILSVIFLLINVPVWFLPVPQLGILLLWAALATTLWSGYCYFADYLRQLGVKG